MQLTKIGTRYEILERLGRGTSADVYLAKDTHMGRNVALKVVEPETSDLQPFFNEARLLCRLQHPNIVTINGSEVIDGKVIVDMEYVPGVSLRQLIQNERRLPVKRALKITAQLLNALNYAHNIGVIHRDVKPANILIGQNDLVKVVDFGIADVLGTQGYLAGAGTFSHMAPECFLEDKSDRRSDLYSVGAILYEMLTGKLPLNAERNTVYVWKEMLDRQEKPKPLTDFLSDIPNGLQGIVSLALNYDKQKRFQGAKDFLDALKRNNLYLLPNSEEELREIDGFEAIYNRIDKHLREELRADRKMGFAEVVRQYAQQHPEWQSKEDLLSLGQVRNNLRHELLDANQYRPMPAAADMERLVNIAEHFGLNPEKLEQAENKRADLDALKAELKKPDHKSQQQHNPVLPATSAPLETEENKETPDQKTRTQEIPNYQPSKPKVQISTAKATPPPIKEEQKEQKSKPKSSASTPVHETKEAATSTVNKSAAKNTVSEIGADAGIPKPLLRTRRQRILKRGYTLVSLLPSFVYLVVTIFDYPFVYNITSYFSDGLLNKDTPYFAAYVTPVGVRCIALLFTMLSIIVSIKNPSPPYFSSADRENSDSGMTMMLTNLFLALLQVALFFSITSEFNAILSFPTSLSSPNVRDEVAWAGGGFISGSFAWLIIIFTSALMWPFMALPAVLFCLAMSFVLPQDQPNAYSVASKDRPNNVSAFNNSFWVPESGYRWLNSLPNDYQVIPVEV